MRDVTLRGTMTDLIGDETFELWLKHGSDDWALYQTGDVDVDESNEQDFLLPGLTEGDQYVAQLRLKRAGRYRIGYLTSSPDTWPEESRAEFVPGALEGVDAPEITDGEWSRTSADDTQIALTISPNDSTKGIHVYRGGVLVGTLDPGETSFVDENPPIATDNIYTASHFFEGLDGPLSAVFDVFSGPLVPAGVTRTSPDDEYGKYTLTWDADGDPVRLQDDYLCDTVFTDRLFTGTVTTDGATGQISVTETPPGATQSIEFHARVRREVTSFAVTDVSDWVQVNVTIDTDDPDPDFHSCP